MGGLATSWTRPAASAPASVKYIEALQQAARRWEAGESTSTKVHRHLTPLHSYFFPQLNLTGMLFLGKLSIRGWRYAKYVNRIRSFSISLHQYGLRIQSSEGWK